MGYFLHDKLAGDILGLHIAKGDGYDTVVSWVINVAAHGRLVFYNFDMV